MIRLSGKYNQTCLLMIFFRLLIVENAESQKIELSPDFGYAAVFHFSRDNNYMSAGNGFEYGISLNHSIGHSWRLEFSYSSLRSDISIVSAHGYREKFSDLVRNSFSVGAVKEFNRGQKIYPYIIVAGGLMHYNSVSRNSYDYSSENLLHFSMAGGLKLKISSGLSLKFQARLLTPVWPKGEYFSTNYFGSIANFSNTKISFGGDFTAGVILIIPDVGEK
jgi:hypothetical protein